jgi:hypothetical protein
MPYEVVIPAIDTALRALLVAHAPLTALLGTKPTARGGGPALYTDGDVPTGATMPYLTFGAWTQIGQHNLSPGSPSGYGWTCTGVIKAIGQRSEASLFAVMSEVFAALPQGQALTVSGYGSGWVDEAALQPTIKTTQAGVVLYEVPAIVRVYVFD